MNASHSPVRQTLQVFLVEDAIAVRRKIAETLSAIPDVTVIGEAEDEATALAGIAESGADVAVVDLRLASGSGIELLSLLAREQPSVVTVVLTNHAGEPFRAACRRAGADFFFDKTSEFDAACKAIEALVKRRAAPAP
ncbi:response regulator [Paraburkholderia lycopersici]|uniref:Response regulator receiver domain-containing protein n=1 Tax=Paraburkholderia lycopersici TaxID=416944 RepID=A0A1G6SE68_9BURK|nr:response regulator [Paraburkholderia lycopersici]SDD15043.1 Response regulator receiver domain-containing protein [Paraburkholderia lycopersici]